MMNDIRESIMKKQFLSLKKKYLKYHDVYKKK